MFMELRELHVFVEGLRGHFYSCFAIAARRRLPAAAAATHAPCFLKPHHARRARVFCFWSILAVRPLVRCLQCVLCALLRHVCGWWVGVGAELK